MSTLVELRPQHRLLNHNFEGYKLSLVSLAQWSRELCTAPDTHHPAEPQYSFLHAKLFALHQHLHPDLHHRTHSLYYIDLNHRVHALRFDPSTRTLEDHVVYDIPENVPRQPGHFNPCLIFPSSELAVLSDGTGFLHIVWAEDRPNPKKSWKTMQSHLLFENDKYFVLVDCRLQEKNEGKVLHCLVESIEQTTEHFSTVLTWVTFEQTLDSWKIISTKELKGKGTVHYVALETECSALYVASDHPFKFTLDTENDIQEEQKSEPRKILYTWLQTADDVTITLKLPNNFNKDHVNIFVDPSHVKVSYAGSTFVNGKFQHHVDGELTTWNIQDDGKLDILVTKSDSGLWNDLIEGGDATGEQILDASLVEEVHQRLAHLCSETEALPEGNSIGFSTQELEECDATSEEDTTLVRLDTVTHTVTHRIPLSVHQNLFQVNLDPREAPAIALRHDVDACVWQPYAQLPNSHVWPVEHHGTLMAFGYVQSSKQNKKFVTCAPNFTYSVVCETSRHVFIYRTNGNEGQGCQLRKRSEGSAKTVSVGQQYVLNIEKWGEVLGVYASNEYLFLLTTTNFVVVEMI